LPDLRFKKDGMKDFEVFMVSLDEDSNFFSLQKIFPIKINCHLILPVECQYSTRLKEFAIWKAALILFFLKKHVTKVFPMITR